jgi:membrane protein DedA with SNARE-associated domain
MAIPVPLLGSAQTSSGSRRVLLGAAVLRALLAGVAVLLVPWLYREHAAVLVLLRPTKEVFLFEGFLAGEGDVWLPLVVLAALPLLLAGVWVFFGLGRAYAAELSEAELPGVAGRLIRKERIDQLQEVLERRGMRVVFLGRLAAFPSTLMAAAAGASGVSWRAFLVADTAGALTSLSLALSLGLLLGRAYDDAGPWLTGLGVAALAALAVVVGRALVSDGSSSRS